MRVCGRADSGLSGRVLSANGNIEACRVKNLYSWFPTRPIPKPACAAIEAS